MKKAAFNHNIRSRGVIPFHGVFSKLHLRYSVLRLWSRRQEQTNWRESGGKLITGLGLWSMWCVMWDSWFCTAFGKENCIVVLLLPPTTSWIHLWGSGAAHFPGVKQWNTEGDEVQQGKFQLRPEKKVQHDQMVAHVSQRDCEISSLRDYSEVIWMWS